MKCTKPFLHSGRKGADVCLGQGALISSPHENRSSADFGTPDFSSVVSVTCCGVESTNLNPDLVPMPLKIIQYPPGRVKAWRHRSRAVRFCYSSEQAAVPRLMWPKHNRIYRCKTIPVLRRERTWLGGFRASLQGRRRWGGSQEVRGVEVTTLWWSVGWGYHLDCGGTSTGHTQRKVLVEAEITEPLNTDNLKANKYTYYRPQQSPLPQTFPNKT